MNFTRLLCERIYAHTLLFKTHIQFKMYTINKLVDEVLLHNSIYLVFAWVHMNMNQRDYGNARYNTWAF